jgi:hypothetical protein
MIKEQTAHIQRKIADTVGAHVKISEWPELMAGIIHLSQSSIVKQQELCLFLIDKLAEYVGPFLVSNLDVVSTIILPFLSETQTIKTRTYAVQALCSVLSELPEGNFNLSDSLLQVPPIILKAIESEEDDILQSMLQFITRLTKEKAEIFISSWMPLFSSLQSVCMCNTLEGTTKVVALEIIVYLITSRKAEFCSNTSSRTEVRVRVRVRV